MSRKKCFLEFSSSNLQFTYIVDRKSISASSYFNERRKYFTKRSLLFNNVLLWYTLEHFYGNLCRYDVSLYEEIAMKGKFIRACSCGSWDSFGEGKVYIETILCSLSKVFLCENFASIYKNVLYTFISNSFLI